MKKAYAAIFLAIVAILAAIFWLSIKPKKDQLVQPANNTSEIRINGKQFSAEIASTPEKMAMGLSDRSELCQDCSMLFVFEKPSAVSFWMKDMRFDLDIVWISGDEIVGIDKDVSHERGTAAVVHPSVPVDKVLEINAGASDRLNLRVGDKISF